MYKVTFKILIINSKDKNYLILIEHKYFEWLDLKLHRQRNLQSN